MLLACCSKLTLSVLVLACSKFMPALSQTEEGFFFPRCVAVSSSDSEEKSSFSFSATSISQASLATSVGSRAAGWGGGTDDELTADCDNDGALTPD